MTGQLNCRSKNQEGQRKEYDRSPSIKVCRATAFRKHRPTFIGKLSKHSNIICLLSMNASRQDYRESNTAEFSHTSLAVCHAGTLAEKSPSCRLAAEMDGRTLKSSSRATSVSQHD